MIELAQPHLLAPIPPVGRFLTFRIAPEADVCAALTQLRDRFAPDCGVVGIGEPAVLALGARVPGLRTFPALSGPACSVPSTQQALMFFLRGPDRGILFDATQEIRAIVGEAFLLEDVNDTFTYHGGRDLTRFEDGTENPCDEKAVASGFTAAGAAFIGSM